MRPLGRYTKRSEFGPLYGASEASSRTCYITGVGNEPRLPVLYSPSKMTTLPLPQAAGNYYFPSESMIHSDWINIALCAAKRGGENVLDMQRWTREYDGYMSILKGKVTR